MSKLLKFFLSENTPEEKKQSDDKISNEFEKSVSKELVDQANQKMKSVCGAADIYVMSDDLFSRYNPENILFGKNPTDKSANNYNNEIDCSTITPFDI